MKQYNVTGMSCAACSARVEKAVSAVPGVSACSVSLLTNSMGVEGTASAEAVIAAVTAAGYGASEKKSRSAKEAPATADALADRETPVLRKRLIFSLGFWLLLMYVSMGHMMWNFPLPPFFADNHVAMGLLELLLTVTVMVINQKFFVSGWKSLLHRAPNMDALVALGSAAAFLYSTVSLFLMTDAAHRGDTTAVMRYMDEFYFESAATILTLVTLGKMLEARSKGKTTSALKGLLRLAPKTATVVRDGAEVTVPAEEILRGEIFVVRPGEVIPADGVVIDGSSAVDESAMTGESIPQDKSAGAAVSAGTINLSGFLRCESTRVGEDTALSQIIETVEAAAATKAPIAKIADRVAGVFVPAVMGIAAVATLVWLIAGAGIGYALARGISVLVISCPCSLGLATPVAIMVGSGMGAKNGILYKTAVSLEETGKTTIVALDKTGTITEGKPTVTDILPVPGVSETRLLTLAYALECKSEHPLARAVCVRAEAEGIAKTEVAAFRALPGNGLTAELDGTPIYGGNYRYISEIIPVPDDVTALSESLAEEGKTPLFFALDDTLLGIIAVADVVRPDSAAAIREMREMGIRVVMLTGDNERTANAIGRQAGVDTVIAGVLPDGKESVIRDLKKQGKVVMVGDGINDAPALTTADVGVAIGAGTDVAIDAADVVLMKSRLTDAAAAIRLSRATLRNIRENLFWAFIYNAIGIPLAAGVLIPFFGIQLGPTFAAAAMSLSSVSVVTNALRLNLFRVYGKKKSASEDTPAIPRETNSKKEIQTMTKTMKIKGMMCPHCEMHTKKALEALDGVTAAEVSHKSGTAVLTLAKDVPNDALTKAVTDAGYTVTSID